jgi:flagellar biosynthesis/type III secretory pathway protein FliH
MADRKPAKKGTKESAKGTAAIDKKSTGFTAEERAAMNERAKEAKAEARGAGRAEGEKALLEKIAEMPKADRVMAKRIHEIVTATAGP